MKQELNIMSENTLRHVKELDILGMKDAMDTFLNWYIRECDHIRQLSEIWIEDESDTIVSILSRGIASLDASTEIVKEADRP